MNQLPVKKNETIQVKIEAMGHEGQGIAKVEGYTLFIEDALLGDEVEILVVKVGKNFGYGKLIKVLYPSENRINPPCPIEKCGGCQLQHMDYQGQLQFKTQIVKDAIHRIGKLSNVPIHFCIGMAKPFYYRNKAQYPVQKENGEIQIGFYAKRSHKIVKSENCIIQDPINEKILHRVKEFMEENDISAYDEINHRGLIRHILIRTAFVTKEIMVCIITNGEEIPHQERLIEKLREMEGMTSILQNINKKKSNVILGEKVKVLWGKEKITDYIGKIKFEISALSFFQVNPMQTEVLYQKALEYADLKGGETVIDAYCGIGTISLFLAQKAKKVIGVEVVAPAIEDAKKNAKINGFDNTEFFVGEAEVLLPKLYNEGLKAEVVVVDPPRKGCDEKFLDTLVSMEPEKIVYVSCNPSTLARDLRYLDERGYMAVEVQPVDMFPYTFHVESIVLMLKVEK